MGAMECPKERTCKAITLVHSPSLPSAQHNEHGLAKCPELRVKSIQPTEREGNIINGGHNTRYALGSYPKATL